MRRYRLTIGIILCMMSAYTFEVRSHNLQETDSARVFFHTTNFIVAPGDLIPIDIMIEPDAPYGVSGFDMTLTFSSTLLEYVPTTEGGISTETCPESDLPYSVIERVKPANTVRIARIMIADEDDIPSGSVCAGTLTFRPRADLQLPATASISFDQSRIEVVGSTPQNSFNLVFDAERSQVTIDIADPDAATATATPTRTGTPAIENSPIIPTATLIWTNTPISTSTVLSEEPPAAAPGNVQFLPLILKQ